jgi:RNA polymerase sigma factor (sigma-70 family)
MDDNSILQLLRSAKQGKGFDALYVHYPKVEKMICRNNGSRDDAKDIYQEALIILYRKVTAENFTLSSQLGTYLFSVCRFLWLAEIRKRGKIPADSFNEEKDRVFAEEINQEAEKEKKFQLGEKAIASLGEKCRKILRLFYFDNKSMDEIAKLLGYGSENTAKNQKYKCLESAKKKLEEII